MKRIFELVLWVLIPFVLTLVYSCKDETNQINKLEDIVFPDSNISYNRFVQPLFNIGCAMAGCHDGTADGYNPNLTSYSSMRYGPPPLLVDPGHPELSILVSAIEGNHSSVRLPLLTPNHIKGIKRWITEGATDTIR